MTLYFLLLYSLVEDISQSNKIGVIVYSCGKVLIKYYKIWNILNVNNALNINGGFIMLL
jgi:hypothetical protein